MGLFINLTPFKHPEKSTIFQGTRFIPLSFEGEGEETLERGFAPLRRPLSMLYRRGSPKGRQALSKTIIPPSLIKGRGSGGWVTK
jgi:hypothetical protein